MTRPLGSRGASLGSLVYLLSDVNDDVDLDNVGAQRLSSGSECEAHEMRIPAEPCETRILEPMPAPTPTSAAVEESLDGSLEHAPAREPEQDAESGEDYYGDEELLSDLDGARPHQRVARRTALQPKKPQLLPTESERSDDEAPQQEQERG